MISLYKRETNPLEAIAITATKKNSVVMVMLDLNITNSSAGDSPYEKGIYPILRSMLFKTMEPTRAIKQVNMVIESALL